MFGSMNRTVRGSCHCGAVRFEAEIDLGATSRCNCSICGKSRFWKAIAAPRSFRLLAGEGALADYTFGGGTIHHHFCRTCGVKPFGRGENEELGGEFHAVNVMCLEGLSPSELAEAAARMEFQDGKHDRWEHAVSKEERGYL